jgi:DNA-binding NtrC family response regulator
MAKQEIKQEQVLNVEEAVSRSEAFINKNKKTISAGAEAVLMQYAWPGNVRELRNVMERAFIMSEGEEIQAEDLAIMDNGNLHTPKTISPTYGVAPAPIEQPEPEAFAPVLPQEGSLQEQVERFEADLIAQAMEREGSIRGAARRLKMDPATLLRRKKKYESKGLM